MAGPGGHNYRGKRYNPKTGEFEEAQPMSDSAGLAPVNDPDKVYADITRQDYLDYVRDYREFEKELLEKASTDTSLIDSAREDAQMAEQRTRDIAQRNVSRYAQRDANQKLLGDLINIGQGVNRSSLQQLGSAAADATQRKNAYSQARAQYKANKYSTIGGLGAAAIMMLPFI